MRLALLILALCAAVDAAAAAPADSLQAPASTTPAAGPPATPIPWPPAGLRPGPPPVTPGGGASPVELDAHALRLTGPITIDGVLSEPIWQGGTPVTRFLQSDPLEGTQATERTEVRVAYDDDALYIGARMYDSHPDSIVARLVRRDTDIPSDRFMVFLDPFHDRRSGYYFGVNAAGVLYDGTLFNDSWDDNSWDAVWQGKARIDGQGWTVEMRIPYSQLRFSRKDHEVWGINFRREITRRTERDYLVYPPKKESGFVSRFPDLVELDGARAGRSIELLPYLTGKAEFQPVTTGDPFNDGSSYKPSGGADLRMGVGGNLTLNATVNPDFGQVEVDPAVVNLSDVESYFPEKRPFFVENSRIFNFGNEGANDYWSFNWPEPQFFYPRRIGRTPQGEVPDSAFADVPTATRILGAAKLTGKLAPGWNFGTLHAVTAREQAQFSGGGPAQSTEVEPLTYYGVVRTQKEFAHMRHGLGFMTSLVARQFGEDTLSNQLNRASLQAGLDGWHFLDRKQVWVISGWAMTSLVTGTAARIAGVQTDAIHYMQRPDARSFSVDSSATSLFGYGARLWLNKQGGSVLLNSAIGFMTPRFDVNDLGFHSRSDVVNGHFGTGYIWNDPNGWRKNAGILGALFQNRDFDDNIVSEGVWGKGQILFANNYNWNMTASYDPQTVNNRLTRGGPLSLNLPQSNWSMYLDTDSKARLYYFIQTSATFSQSGSQYFSLGPGVEWRPISNLTMRVSPTWERVLEDAQYVTTVADPAATDTYGQRYVFGALDQKTVSAQIRLDWAFSPRLTLQTFVQPLISSGVYTGYKELARPRTYDFNRYGQNGSTIDLRSMTVDPDGPGPAQPFSFDNPDFNILSLRGNAVLRWEYLPGSALFLVWTQERNDETVTGPLEFQSSFDRLMSASASNIFLAKLTYYFTR